MLLPLYRLKSFWENQDLNLLFGIDGLDAGQFNDDAYGRSLDKLADAEPFKLVSSVCLNMAKAHDIPIKQLHFDTTSKSVQGVYESTTEDPLVTLGHSKDHRPDLKQIKFGCGVTKEGLPVLGEVLPGNTSDQVWNPEAILKAKAYFDNNGYKDIIFIGDCATVQSEENLLAMSNLRFISRFSERFNLASELKLNAFESEEPWLYLDEQKQVIPSMNESTQWSYRMKEFDRTIENKQLRFIVIESGSLIKQRLKKLEKSIIKQAKQLEKTIKLEERNEVLEVSKGVTHKRPTVKSIIEAIKNTLIIEMNGNRYFDTNESRNAVLFKVLDLVGFKPDIYLNYVE